jgi:hypothetical protein
MLWFALVLLSAVTGLCRGPWWTGLLPAVTAIAVGVLAVVTEPANYDMHGFGYLVGAVAAVVCVLAWLLGFGMATLVRRARRSEP